MATAIRVEAAVPGRKRAGTAEHPVELDLTAGAMPLRTLIDAVVRAEVRSFQQRAEESTFIRVLTEKALEDGLQRGAIRSGGAEVSAAVDVDEAVATALLAHEDGLYEVLVDDEPVGDLDAVITVSPATRLLFLRLVPLAGG
jgi:hypothetical protein